MKSQKKIFLDGEGDQWFNRNHQVIAEKDFSKDLIINEILDLLSNSNDPAHKDKKSGLRILEIGCGEGIRLGYLKDIHGFDCYGVEPSKKAVEKAKSNGVNAKIGSADCLPFDDKYFDILIFGFCLYLCDRRDLFRIASEANRVLDAVGYVIIFDFYYTGKYKRNPYSHFDGIYSYKMDYRKLFTWHPYYECYNHKILDHSKLKISDQINDWVSLSVLRKNSKVYDE